VRPDQHVAWRGDDAPADPLRLVDLIRGASAERASKPADARKADRLLTTPA